MSTTSFQRSAKVTKRHGVSFRGVVLGTLPKMDGTLTCVVEADHPDFKGIVHTYAPEQLMEVVDVILIEPSDVPIGSTWEHVKGHIYIVTNLSIDEQSLEWSVTYQLRDRPTLQWTRRYSVFKDRFHRVLL